jgi:hypothetical protein
MRQLRKKEEITGTWFFLKAMVEVGAADKFVDIEDIYERMWQLDKKRYSWRTKSYPSIRKCVRSKESADQETWSSKLTVKDGPHKRRLSDAGQKWVKANQDGLDRIGRERIPQPKNRQENRALKVLKATNAFRRWVANKHVPEESWEVADLLRCAPNSEPTVLRHRMEVLRSDADSMVEEEAIQFLDRIVETHPALFGG